MVWKIIRVTTSQHDRPPLGPALSQPRLAPAGPGDRARPARGAPRCGEEDQAGHAGGGDDQHRDLADGVPGPDVDQDHVDDVVAAAERDRRSGKSAETGVAVPRADGDERHARRDDPDRDAERDPADPAGADGPLRDLVGQPAQHQHEHHDRHGLDQELGQRQVRRAVQDEQHGDAVAGDADQHHRGQPAQRPHRGDGRDDDPAATTTCSEVSQARHRRARGPR